MRKGKNQTESFDGPRNDSRATPDECVVAGSDQFLLKHYCEPPEIVLICLPLLNREEDLSSYFVSFVLHLEDMQGSK